MSLFSAVGLNSVDIMPYLNTGTLLDIALGVYEKSHTSQWILNGGLAPITGVCGRAGHYKSTIVDSIIAQILVRYPTIEVWKHDTEQNTFSLTRFDRMAGKEISNNIRLTNATAYTLPEFMEALKEICAHKEKHKKDYVVQSPFLDHNGDRLNIWIPTIVDIDSFSCLRTYAEELLGEGKTSVEDGSRNMDDMHDGKVKRKLMFDFSRWAQKYGIYFVLTAHVDDTHDIDPRKPTQKQLQFLRQGDRLKSVGSQFEFLTNVLLQGTSPTPILDSDKGPEYPNGNTMNVDINEVHVKILRCKTNATGTLVPLAMSQNLGILGNLTNYHFLKKNGDFGFIKKGHNRYHMLGGDTLLHRNSVIDVLNNSYEDSRALEILAQLKWISLYWNVNSQPFDIPKSAEEFVEKISASNSIAISDIKNSRGYWTFNETKDDRPYMSVFDILEIIGKK